MTPPPAGAVDTLEAVAGDAGAPPFARVAAAKAILDAAYKGACLENLAVTLEELERLRAEIEPEEQNGR